MTSEQHDLLKRKVLHSRGTAVHDNASTSNLIVLCRVIKHMLHDLREYLLSLNEDSSHPIS